MEIGLGMQGGKCLLLLLVRSKSEVWTILVVTAGLYSEARADSKPPYPKAQGLISRIVLRQKVGRLKPIILANTRWIPAIDAV